MTLGTSLQRTFFLSLGISMALFPGYALAGTLYLDPPQATYGRGDTFMMSVRVDPQGECINAAHIEISYPNESMRAVDFSRGGSILSLWISEPSLDHERGVITFEGGVPGGYCGRIPGDPVLSNVLGKIVFSVMGDPTEQVTIKVEPTSELYLNDGMGTRASLQSQDAQITIVQDPTLSGNEWLSIVDDDTIPPDVFAIELETMRGLFGGDYFAVFSTVDKQSGLSHYEIFERGAWKTIESPYRLKEQSLRNPVQIRAIDKAGNERLGSIDMSTIPEREISLRDYAIVALLMALLLLGWVTRWYTRRTDSVEEKASPPQS